MGPKSLVLTGVWGICLGVSYTAFAAPPIASDGRASAAREAALLDAATRAQSRSRLIGVLRAKGAVRDRGLFPDETRDEGAASSSSSDGSVSGVLCTQPAANCQANDRSVAHTSDGAEFIVAENFRPSVSGAITEVCWHGGYFDFTDGPEGEQCPTLVQNVQNSFRIRYFNDNNGVPGTMIATFSSASGTLPFSRNPTTEQIAGLITESEYIAVHQAVNVVAGQCYWIEITNNIAQCPNPPCSQTCSWLWEGGVATNGWLLQDDGTGYDIEDALPENAQFCLNIPLQSSATCQPPPPANDNCANAQTIVGRAEFDFTNLTATTDGPSHNACLAFSEDQIEADVWFKWTSPCTDTVIVSTCDLTDLDTRIAVYEGSQCPVSDARLLACNDDRCGELLAARQSMAVFSATEGTTYLFRIGVFPGGRRGADKFRVQCGPPDLGTCPAAGSCCDENGSPGCDDELCCELVCFCDPLCCDPTIGLWDSYCAGGGFGESGCGAQFLCQDACGICPESEVDCCVGAPPNSRIPGCSDPDCCAAVCAEDAWCCEVEWDLDCATLGFNENGHGAAVLCPELCGGAVCPSGTVTFVDPASGVVDARQPHPPSDDADRQGIRAFIVSGPEGFDSPDCWTLCESTVDGLANGIEGITDNGDGTFTITLQRSISIGGVTTLTYTPGDASAVRGEFTSHPGNVNGDSASGPPDILALIDILNAVSAAPWGRYSSDVDISGASGPPDILRVIDLLNGAGDFDPWLNVAKPGCGACCSP